MISTLLLALGVFATVAVGDWVWTRYSMAVASRHAHHAAVFAVLIVLVGAVSTLAYVDNHLMILPAALGAWVGTFFTVRKHAPGREPDLADKLAEILDENAR